MAASAVSPTTPALGTLRDLLALAGRGQLATVLGLMLAAALTEGIGILMLVPMLALLDGNGAAMGGLAGKLIGLGGIHWTIGGILALFLFLVLLRSAVQHAQAVASIRLQQDLVDALRRRLFAALMTSEWRWLAGRRASDHVATLVVNVGRVGSAINQLLLTAAAAVTATVYLVLIFLLSWRIALIALAGGMIALAGFGRHRRQAMRLGQGLNAANRDLQASAGDAFSGLRTTRILGREAEQIDDFAARLAAIRNQQQHYAASASHGRVAMQIGGAALLAILVWLGVVWWSIPLATLLPVLLVLGRLVPMLGTIQQGWHFWLHSAPAAEEANAIFAEAGNNAELAAASPVPVPFAQAIELDAVDLTYAGRDLPALHGISLTIPALSTTAIIGPSGAGKSSLADLLTGLVSPDSGTMSVDGTAIQGPLRQQWRRSVAYVEQDCFLFHGSIRANLLWAAPAATDAELEQALRTASAGFVLDLPAGLDTLVGDAGVQLSGGERQRIGLARALLGKPALLVLDEATSALDPANEIAIKDALAAMKGRVTLVIVGHRLALLDLADRVVRLEGGRIVERGA